MMHDGFIVVEAAWHPNLNVSVIFKLIYCITSLQFGKAMLQMKLGLQDLRFPFPNNGHYGGQLLLQCQFVLC